MRNIWAIFKKELKTYFSSPMAYAVIAIFLLIAGFFFYSLIWWFNSQSLYYASNPYWLKQLNINQMVYAPLFGNISIVLLLMLPVVTMRLFAEEKKMGTEELLYTSPISVNQIILGKYFAALVVLLTMLGLTGIYSVFTFVYGNPELKPILTGYLGLFLLGAAFISIGLFFSSLTENQIVAAVLSFGALLLLWILNWLASASGPVWKEILNYLSFFRHFDELTRGVLDTTDIFYYLSFSFFGLFLTHSVIQSRRWR
ncbi:MAG: ABC transporter permease subunit [Candidatus Aminicenantia bacterium]